MQTYQLNFRAETRISPKVVLGIVILLDYLFILGAQVFQAPGPVVDRAYNFYLVFFAFALVGVLLDFWYSLLARWYTVLGGLWMICLAALWLQTPAALALLSLPVGLAVAVIGLRAAGAATLVSTLLLAGLYLSPAARIDIPTLIVSLVAVWSMLGLLLLIYIPINQFAAWINEHFARTAVLLEDARGRKAELEQALQSLAHANRQLALASKKMAVLSQIADEAQRAKSAFVANVSHEFRTPLNMIIGLVDLMIRNPENYDVVLSPKMREDFGVVYRNCEHLSNMVNDVLDLTRVETGRLMLHREWVDLREIVEKAVMVVRPLLNKKRLVLDLAIPPDLPQVYCDRVRIQQVILNLLSNAARFTDQGKIAIDLRMEGQRLYVSVADTGAGISPENKERIFEPFWQGKDPVWSKKGGSGLGLSLSREFVHLHGGHMWFESQPGEGTCFFFYLPISPLTDPLARPDRYIKKEWVWEEKGFLSGQAGATQEIIKPRVILFDQTATLYPRFARSSDRVEFLPIDDLNQIACQGMAQAFILNAPSREAAWPMMDAALGCSTTTPVIACSVPGELERAQALGMKGYLIKPVKIDDLKRAIASAGRPVSDVLIVDDDGDVLDLYRRMLLTCDPGLEVRTACLAEEGLAQVRRALPDLMFVDVVMPGLTGWEMCEALKEAGLLDQIASYFITAQDPVDQLASGFFAVSIQGGLSLNKILGCSLEVARILMESERESDPAYAQNLPNEPAWK